jgi:hypothetical protein
VAATKSPRRRRATRRRTSPPTPGKTAWVTLDAQGQVVKENGYGAGSALIVTQRLAELALEPVSFTVERRDLFGPAALLYRVVRDEDGNVSTTIISNED